ncbi:hypothetical protein Slin15195_G085400 [Septoria linicola]|uniref:Uncharacterized protein n=1 Tax=Septoria linicola TaxID=215465 RepID=A0A9Q9B0T4_9PEZI|nr:hypothetical protein Slin15195_G085400 [Septoria linicola]
MVRLLVQHEAFDAQRALSRWGDDRYQYVDAAVAEGHQTILAFLLSSRQPHHNNWTTWLGIADSYDQVGSRRTLEDAMSRISTLLLPQRRSTITLKSGRVNIASEIIEDYPQEASPEHRARLAIELNRATTFCHILGEGSMKEESLGRLADLAIELDSSAIFDRILIQMLLTPDLSRDLATTAVMHNRQDYLPRLFEQIRPTQSALAELAQSAAKLERGPSFCAYVNHSMLEEECVETLFNLLEAPGRDELGSVYDLITEYTNLENLWALASYAFKTRQTKTTAAVQLFRRLNPSDLLCFVEALEVADHRPTDQSFPCLMLECGCVLSADRIRLGLWVSSTRLGVLETELDQSSDLLLYRIVHDLVPETTLGASPDNVLPVPGTVRCATQLLRKRRCDRISQHFPKPSPWTSISLVLRAIHWFKQTKEADPVCVPKPLSLLERMETRDERIQALQPAIEILSRSELDCRDEAIQLFREIHTAVFDSRFYHYVSSGMGYHDAERTTQEQRDMQTLYYKEFGQDPEVREFLQNERMRAAELEWSDTDSADSFGDSDSLSF